MKPQSKVGMFGKAVGLILLAYVVYCIARGRIDARMAGAAARPVLRSERPVFFWFVISCHITVALVMMFAL